MGPEGSTVKRAALPGLITIGVITAIGAALRLLQLGSQIVGDDEWHAVKVASQSSYGHIFTHFNAADNSIPLTIIYKLFIDTLGLNELTLHLLQATAGILMIPLFYRWTAGIVGKHAAALFSFLLSVSPFLVYYSRFARPYIFVVLLSFMALLSFFFWLQSGKRRYLVAYVTGGIFSAYFSPVSLPSLAAPLLFFLVLAVLKQKLPETWRLPGEVRFLDPAVAGAGLACGILLWLLPAWGSIGEVTSKAGKGEIGPHTFEGALELFSGFGGPGFPGLLAALALFGLWRLYRTDRLFFCFIATIAAVQFSAMVVAAPYRVELPHVFARYSIPCLPFYLLLVSVGSLELGRDLRRRLAAAPASDTMVTFVAVAAFALLYVGWSPLRTVYGATNSFSNHDDFQYNYVSEVYRDRTERAGVSSFYRNLRNEPGAAIIEYPYVLWWSGNIYHYYQQVHRKKVLIGYVRPFYLLQPVVSDQQINLGNFVPIDSDEGLARSGARYLVVHKDIAWEAPHVRDILGGGNGLDRHARGAANFLEERYGPPSRSMAEFVAGGLSKRLGGACFEDDWIVVFRVPVSASSR